MKNSKQFVMISKERVQSGARSGIQGLKISLGPVWWPDTDSQPFGGTLPKTKIFVVQISCLVLTQIALLMLKLNLVVQNFQFSKMLLARLGFVRLMLETLSGKAVFPMEPFYY